MKKTLFIIFLVAVIVISACAKLVNGNANLTVENQSSADIFSVGVDCMSSVGGNTEVSQNADNSLLEKNDKLTFEMGEIEDYTFTVNVLDKNGMVIASKEFTLSFNDGQKYTIYIFDDASGGIYLSE